MTTRKRILLVEDETWQAEALIAKLNAAGVDVAVATSEDEALGLLAGEPAERYVLAVVDMMLVPSRFVRGMPFSFTHGDPRHAGLRIIRFIREDRLLSAARLPILVYSVWREDDLMKQVRSLDAVYILKGQPQSDVIAAVTDMLRAD